MIRKWKIFIITSLVLFIAFAHYYSQFYLPDRLLLNNSRRTDSLFRYGGDEFLLLLPQTPGELAFMLAHRLREEIGKLIFRDPKNEPFKIDVSIGVIEYQRGFKNIEEMLAKLDTTLYRAKKTETHLDRAE